MTSLAGILSDKESAIKALALESLQKASGKKYTTPEEWAKWAASL